MCKVRKKGFTLIELLVVIAIIALLLSILMPSLAKVKEYSRRLVCSAHMRQFGLASHLYSLNHNDYLQACIGSSLPKGHPNFLSEDPATMVTWDKALEPYLSTEVEDPTVDTGERDIFSCPTDRLPREPDGQGNDRRIRSYSQLFYYNVIGEYNKPGEGFYPWHNSHMISKAKKPVETLLFTEWHTFHNLRQYNNPGCIIYFLYWYSGWPLYGGSLPSPREALYHGNGNVYLFLDGHGGPLTPKVAETARYWEF